MPMTRRQVTILYVTFALTAATIAMLLVILMYHLRTTPNDVLTEIRAVRVEMQAATNSTRTLIGANKERIEAQRKTMDRLIEQLKKAYDQLKKLDPQFEPEPIPELVIIQTTPEKEP